MTETLSEIVEREAAEAESEYPDVDEAEQEGEDTPEPEAEPEADAEPAEQESFARMEEISKKLDALKKHVSRRIGDILGEDATLYRPCMCFDLFDTPGFLPPIDPTPDAQAFMYHWLGQHAPGDYRKDGYSSVCGTCDGLGQVATGSHVTGQEYLTCIDCKGLGWRAAGPERSGGFAPQTRPENVDANGEIHTPTAPPPEPDTPEVAALKAQGYVVIPPYQAP